MDIPDRLGFSNKMEPTYFSFRVVNYFWSRHFSILNLFYHSLSIKWQNICVLFLSSFCLVVSRLYFFSFDGCRFKFFRSRHWFYPKMVQSIGVSWRTHITSKKVRGCWNYDKGYGAASNSFGLLPGELGKRPILTCTSFQLDGSTINQFSIIC